MKGGSHPPSTGRSAAAAFSNDGQGRLEIGAGRQENFRAMAPEKRWSAWRLSRVHGCIGVGTFHLSIREESKNPPRHMVWPGGTDIRIFVEKISYWPTYTRRL